jgi:hypothetical protein
VGRQFHFATGDGQTNKQSWSEIGKPSGDQSKAPRSARHVSPPDKLQLNLLQTSPWASDSKRRPARPRTENSITPATGIRRVRTEREGRVGRKRRCHNRRKVQNKAPKSAKKYNKTAPKPEPLRTNVRRQGRISNSSKKTSPRQNSREANTTQRTSRALHGESQPAPIVCGETGCVNNTYRSGTVLCIAHRRCMALRRRGLVWLGGGIRQN